MREKKKKTGFKKGTELDLRKMKSVIKKKNGLTGKKKYFQNLVLRMQIERKDGEY